MIQEEERKDNYFDIWPEHYFLLTKDLPQKKDFLRA